MPTSSRGGFVGKPAAVLGQVGDPRRCRYWERARLAHSGRRQRDRGCASTRGGAFALPAHFPGGFNDLSECEDLKGPNPEITS